MKPTLPICIPSLPSPDTSPALWRQIAPILNAIAEREQNDESLYPYEKIAYSALSYANWNANNKRWGTLWQYLLDRQIVRIGTVPTPSQKPKSDRPTKPPKNKIAKPTKEKKPRPKRVRNRRKVTNRKSPTCIVEFVRLKPCLSGLRSLATFWQWLAYAAPLCPRSKPPLRLRSKGEKIKPILCAKTKDGDWSRLRVWMRSDRSWYKIGDNVRDLLIEWSNPYRTKARKRIVIRFDINLNPEKEPSPILDKETTPKRVIRVISMDTINQVLTDKWQDIGAITDKLNAILEKPIELSELSKLLRKRSLAGLLKKFQYPQKALTYYSRIEATEFENQWLTLDMAYQIAQSRGFKGAKNTFRKHHKCDYAAYGLEFRRDVPVTENKLLRWRDIQS
jgi:hypothetical protein